MGRRRECTKPASGSRVKFEKSLCLFTHGHMPAVRNRSFPYGMVSCSCCSLLLCIRGASPARAQMGRSRASAVAARFLLRVYTYLRLLRVSSKIWITGPAATCGGIFLGGEPIARPYARVNARRISLRGTPDAFDLIEADVVAHLASASTRSLSRNDTAQLHALRIG